MIMMVSFVTETSGLVPRIGDPGAFDVVMHE